MLNEMVDMHEAFEKIGCEFASVHPFFKKCPKNKTAFTIAIAEDGKVNDVGLPDFDIEQVYRWQEDNQQPTFPAFNARSLFEITNDFSGISEANRETVEAFVADLKNPRKKTLEPIPAEAFIELEAACKSLWDEDMVWLGRCLKEIPNAIRPMLGEIPVFCKPFEELITRTNICQATGLREELRVFLRHKLLQTGERVYAEALFAIPSERRTKRRGKEYQKDYMYLLIIDDWRKCSEEAYPVHHQAVQSWLKTQLEEFFRSQHIAVGKPDAFGYDLAGSDDNFSPVDVGGIGRAVPFASNNAIPCLKRYGLEGTKLFQAGLQIRLKMAKAMNYALDPQKLDETSWKSITKYEPGRAKRKTIVFAYCTAMKNSNALQFFDRNEDDDSDVYSSEIAVKQALSTFDGIAKEKPETEIVIGILSAIDPGNTKLIASRRYTLSELSRGAVRWQAANKNIPRLFLPSLVISSKKDNRRSTTDPIPIYPLEIIKILNTDWDQDGTMRSQSKRFIASEALDFLFEGDRSIVARSEQALSFLIEKTSGVIIRAALKAKRGNDRSGKNLRFKDSKYVHMLPSLFGLLLYKMGIGKEDYMNETLFYLGRYFAAVDDLYIQYHKDVRSGNVPISLLGNDYLSLALQNPLEAFVTISRRLAHPYYSWAKRTNTEEKTGQIAKYCIKRIAEFAEELSKAQIPNTVADTDKAKILLGYLSYGPRKDQTPATYENQTTNEGEKP